MTELADAVEFDGTTLFLYGYELTVPDTATQRDIDEDVEYLEGAFTTMTPHISAPILALMLDHFPALAQDVTLYQLALSLTDNYSYYDLGDRISLGTRWAEQNGVDIPASDIYTLEEYAQGIIDRCADDGALIIPDVMMIVEQ